MIEAAPIQAVEQRKIRAFCGNDHFAADFMLEAHARGKTRPLSGCLRGRTWLSDFRVCNNTGMNDTAVSTSLVLRNILPFFQDENPCFGILFAHSHSRCQSDDSPSDDYVVMHGWNWGLTIYRRAITALNASFRGAFSGKKKPPRTGRARRPR